MARAQILTLPAVAALTACAPLFETSPVDCDGSAGNFFNTVAELDVADSASLEQLLASLRQIEVSLGRPDRHPKNASRPMDLDILYAGALKLQSPTLILPHPRLHERRFVLAPLAAIRPDLRLPGQIQTVADLLRSLNDPAKVSLVSESW